MLALRLGQSYEQAVRERILQPLEMTNTSITLNEEMRNRLARGHNARLRPVSNWDFDVLAGCGALRSTASDMLKFLAANLDLVKTPLNPAMRMTRSRRRPTTLPETEIAMAWHILTKFGADIFWHNGGTGGYRSFAGFSPAKKKAVIVLCNTFSNVDGIGLRALDGQYPEPV